MAKWTTVATWEDAPHLTEEMKATALLKIEPHLREVRTKGMPTFGAGLVWPVDLSQILVPPFAIPDTFYRSFALDTGWKCNGAVFFAEDRSNGVTYVYDVFKRGQVEPPIVAAAIQARGKWIAGVADAADTNRRDGKQYIDIYKALGLDIELPNKAIETGVTKVWQMFCNGSLKVFSHCTALTDEMRVYMRDSKHGGIKEDQDDHLCDGLRHGCMSALRRGKMPPKKGFPEMDWNKRPAGGSLSWMA